MRPHKVSYKVSISLLCNKDTDIEALVHARVVLSCHVLFVLSVFVGN